MSKYVMQEQRAIEIAFSFALQNFECEVDLLQAFPGVQLDDHDRDCRVWNVVFRSKNAPDDGMNQYRELWVVVDDITEEAHLAPIL